MDEAPDQQDHPGVEAHHEGVASLGPVTVTRQPAVDYEPTGVAAVDRVLAEVAAVVDAPVDEHVQVFERAHEQLRRALDAQPEPAAGDPGA